MNVERIRFPIFRKKPDLQVQLQEAVAECASRSDRIADLEKLVARREEQLERIHQLVHEQRGALRKLELRAQALYDLVLIFAEELSEALARPAGNEQVHALQDELQARSGLCSRLRSRLKESLHALRTERQQREEDRLRFECKLQLSGTLWRRALVRAIRAQRRQRLVEREMRRLHVLDLPGELIDTWPDTVRIRSKTEFADTKRSRCAAFFSKQLGY